LFLQTMSHPFPEESVQKEYEIIDIFKKENDQLRPLQKAEALVETFEEDRIYGFQDNLRTGLYAPWPHERDAQHIMRYNCTTIIPTIYLWAEALGYEPQIVQFKDFRQLRSKKDKDKPTNNSHFALIVDIQRKQPYLLDPFWGICNPIVERTPRRMVLGQNKRRGRMVREYGRLLEYSPEEFAAMIDDLHDPIRSLEMLVCGQKVKKNIFLNKEVPATLMAYYDAPEMVITRLEIPQTAITDKVIFGGLHYDRNGKVKKMSLELCLARDTSWTEVIGKVEIARGSVEEFDAIRKVVHTIKSRPEKNKGQHRRWGNMLSERPERAADLCALTTQLYDRLTVEEKAGLSKRLLVRTLYEHAEPQEEYLTTREERFKEIECLRAKEIDFSQRIDEVEQELWKQSWRLEKLEKTRSERLKGRGRRLGKRNGKIVADLRNLLILHWRNESLYHRRMDQVVFAQKYEKISEEELAKEVQEKGDDPMIGYAAMVVDFLPFLVEAKDHLELRPFQDSIGEKIKAKMESISSEE